MAEFSFDAHVYRWQARSDADWYFAEVPEELSEQIREMQHPAPRRGFGAVRVRVTVGGSTWRTSIFPGGAGTYSLPLKQSVRRSEGLVEGGAVTVHLELVDV